MSPNYNLEKEISVITLGCFLHDIGKVVQRADSFPNLPNKNHQRFGEDFITKIFKDCGIEKISYDWNCILKSIRHHHAKDGPSNAKNTYIPWLVYEADNLASAHDREEQTKLRDKKTDDRLDETDDSVKNNWDSSRRLQSIFTCLENADEDSSYFDLWLREYLEDKKIWKSEKYPLPDLEKEIKKDTKEQYEKLKLYLKRLIENISHEEISLKLANKCIGYLEELFQFIPPDTYVRHTNDVSLFDHLKLTAAIGSCLFYYLKENKPDLFKDPTNEFSYKDSSWNVIDKNKIRDEKAYLLLKADLSGIQDFIYNISSKGALKTLRGRSFYLELLLQQTADEILNFFLLSRCNQIYLGGGGFSLLLPNIEYVKNYLELLENEFNKFLFDKIQGRLHLSFGYSELSGNDIRAHEKDAKQKEHPLNKAWKNISDLISSKKKRKFSHLLESIFESKEIKDYSQRLDECKVCHKEEEDLNLIDSETIDLKVCSSCKSFKDFGLWLTTDEHFKFTEDATGIFPKIKERKIVPVSLNLADKNDPESFIFHNNDPYKPPKIYWSTTYAKSYNNPDQNATFEELAYKKATGVKRVGVLRADIDNFRKSVYR